jgi:hypothetical protein
MFIPDPDFFHPDPGVKKHWIPDPDSQHSFLKKWFLALFASIFLHFQCNLFGYRT